MPKNIPLITGDEVVDVSIQDISQSLFRVAKEMRHVMQTAANVTLWDTTNKGQPLLATVVKAGHHPLVVLLIEQARRVDHWRELDELAKSDCKRSGPDGEWIDVDALDQRIKIASNLSKTITEMRETMLRIQTAGGHAMHQANDLIVKLQGLAQAYRIHKEKMGMDLDNAGDAELLVIAEEEPSVNADVPTGPGRLEKILESP